MTRIKENSICELLLFHSTTKDNLRSIMKEGIKPGMKGGWCDLWIKQLEKEIPPLTKEELEREKRGIDKYRKECQEYIFLSPDFHALEHETPEGSETIIILCIPKKIAYIPSLKLQRVIPFEEWEQIHDLSKEYNEVLVKETISPRYIIGCLDIDLKERVPYSLMGRTKFKINKNLNQII